MIVHHVVFNSSASSGNAYGVQRDGKWLRPLDGFKIYPTDCSADGGEQQVRVYRVNRPDGEWLDMTPDGTLDIHEIGPNGEHTLIETVVAAAMTGACFIFPLTADYSAKGGATLRFRFTDETEVTITANVEELELFPHRTSYDPATGTWAIVSALVASDSNKNVTFRSTNPSIARVEIPTPDSTWWAKGGDLQPGQWAIVIGVEIGQCSIECISDEDPEQVDAIAIKVIKDPDDDTPSNLVGDLAGEVEAALACVRVGIVGGINGCPTIDAYVLDERRVIIPGTPDDLFAVPITITGTVPKTNAHELTPPGGIYFTGFRLAFAVVGCRPLSVGAKFVDSMMQAILDADCCATINTESAVGSTPNTETLNYSKTLYLRGGSELILSWMVSSYGSTYYASTLAALSGTYIATLEAGTVTHYRPAGEDLA